MNVDELKRKRDRNQEMHKTTRSIFAMLITSRPPFQKRKEINMVSSTTKFSHKKTKQNKLYKLQKSGRRQFVTKNGSLLLLFNSIHVIECHAEFDDVRRR